MPTVTLLMTCNMTDFDTSGLSTVSTSVPGQRQITQSTSVAFLYGTEGTGPGGIAPPIIATTALFDTLDTLNNPDLLITGLNVSTSAAPLNTLLANFLAGSDTVIGTVGADTLLGGTGNDTYFVTAGDVVVESATGGTDTVQSATSLDLASFANVENIKLTGLIAVSAVGNSGANVLDGASNTGANALTGLQGNDTYVIGAGDTLFEAAGAAGGADLVRSPLISLSLASYANVENAELVGSGKLNLTGNSGINTLTGNSGSNIIASGFGNDVLRGGAGNDFFVFNSALNATTNRDSIADFVAINDTIRLENAIFTGLGAATGVLATAKFWASATGLAHDADDRIIYNTTTGMLTYDSNGSAAGGAVAFATLTTKPAITAADFVVI